MNNRNRIYELEGIVMDTQALKTFLVLAKLRNFTKTADELFVAQSTVTNRIIELENEVGKPLFYRNKRRVDLTEEGEQFYNYAKRILVLTEEGIRNVNAMEQYKEKLHIGMTNTIYECFLYPVIKSFMKKHQDTALKVTISHSIELIQSLQDGLMDIVYTYIPLYKAGYLCEVYAVDELVLVTSSDNEKYLSGIYKEELKNTKYFYCNFALQEVGLFVRELFPPHYQFGFEIDNSTKLISYIMELNGVSFVPERIAKLFILEGRLRKIKLLDFQAPKINCYKIDKENQNIKFDDETGK